jgi:hypothetical protein
VAVALVDIQVSEGVPENTVIMGRTVMLNVGGASPQWVLDLAEDNPTELVRQIYQRIVNARVRELLRGPFPMLSD